MPRYVVPSPIATGESKPIDPSRHSLVKLPAEIRNHIFGYLVEYSEPIVIELEYSLNSARHFYLGAGFEMHKNLLLACRTTYLEVASLFYANNTFVIERNNPKSTEEIEQLIIVYEEWLRKLGSHVFWHRKFSIDLSKGWAWVGCRGFEEYKRPHPESFNIGSLLQFLWDCNLAVDITFINNLTANGIEFNAPAITTVFRSLLEGQLMLKASRSQVWAVAIDYDGRGGSFGLRAAQNWWDDSRMVPDDDQQHSFVAGDDGRRLSLARPKPTLLGLYGQVLYKIISEAASHPKEVRIDLDVDTKLPLGLGHTNQEFYKNHRSHILYSTPYTLILRSTEKRSTFNKFSKLARLLRHQFPIPIDSEEMEWANASRLKRKTWIIEDADKLDIVLNFNLPEPTALEDLGISILPLVLETSSSPGNREVTIRSLSPGTSGQNLVAERTISLQELRLTVVTTMMIDVHASDQSLHHPDLIWINGLGEVVGKEAVPYTYGRIDHDVDTASTMRFCGSWFGVDSLHPKDRRYRPKFHRYECKFEDWEQFFPFEHCAAQILRYLMWVLEEYNTAYTRRLRYVYVSSYERVCALTIARVFENSPLQCSCHEDECESY